jgi:hypothetical protein
VTACSLDLHLDRAPATFRPGEQITGHVRIESPSGLPGRQVVLTAVAHTQVHDGRREQRAEVATLLDGSLDRGEVRELPFQFLAPSEPLSYAGKHLAIEWRVEVTVSQGEWTDANAARPFQLEPGPATARRARELQVVRGEAAHRDERGISLLLPAAVVAFAVLGAASAPAVGGWGGLAVRGSSVATGGAALLWLAFAAWGRLARRSLRLEVAIGGPEVGRGAVLPFEVRLRTSPATVTADLLCMEHTHVEGDCSHSPVRSRPADFGPAIRRDGATIHAGTVAIPEDLPPSFGAGADGIRWFLRVTVRGGPWIWVSEEYKVVVAA